MKRLKFVNYFICWLNTVLCFNVAFKVSENISEKNIVLLSIAIFLLILEWLLVYNAYKKK